MPKPISIVAILLPLAMIITSFREKDLGSTVTEVDSIYIDSLFFDYNLDDGPGAAVMIIKGRTILFSKGYG